MGEIYWFSHSLIRSLAVKVFNKIYAWSLMIRDASLKSQFQGVKMTVAENNENELKKLITERFFSIFESHSSELSKEEKIAFGKKLALNLISIASIGLVIGFLISFLI